MENRALLMCHVSSPLVGEEQDGGDSNIAALKITPLNSIGTFTASSLAFFGAWAGVVQAFAESSNTNPHSKGPAIFQHQMSYYPRAVLILFSKIQQRLFDATKKRSQNFVIKRAIKIPDPHKINALGEGSFHQFSISA